MGYLVLFGIIDVWSFLFCLVENLKQSLHLGENVFEVSFSSYRQYLGVGRFSGHNMGTYVGVPPSSALFQLSFLPTQPFFHIFSQVPPTQPSTNSALDQLSPSFSQLSSMFPQLSPFPTQPFSNSVLLKMRWGGLQDGGCGGRSPPLGERLCKKSPRTEFIVSF